MRIEGHDDVARRRVHAADESVALAPTGLLKNLGLTRGVARTCVRDGSVKRSSTEMAQVLEEQRGNKGNQKDCSG